MGSHENYPSKYLVNFPLRFIFCLSFFIECFDRCNSGFSVGQKILSTLTRYVGHLTSFDVYSFEGFFSSNFKGLGSFKHTCTLDD